MTYRASWRNTKGIWVLCAGISLLLVTCGAIVSDVTVAALAVGPVGLLYAIGFRLSAYLDQDKLGYRGWFSAHEAKWEDIVSVVRTLDLPYPRDRWYGPVSYEVRTESVRFIVNLLYFPPEFARA